MAFHIDTYHIPRIYGYNHAKELFKSITPIRGGDQSVRRLGKRSDANKWLKHEIREGVDVFIAGLHSTDVVTFYPSHYEIYMGGWDSQSTMMFIEAVTGNPCSSVQKKNYIPSGFPDINEARVVYDGHPIYANTRYKFDYDDKPLSALPSLQKYKVNRKKMSEVRKIAKPFIEYLTAMSSLSDAVGDRPHGTDYWTQRREIQGEKLVARLSMDDKFWETYQYLSEYTATYEWQPQGQRVTINPSNMKKHIEKELRHVFAKEVLEVV